jgi:4-hydroxy-3-methylbut-2-enyl diphosphate reductase
MTDEIQELDVRQDETSGALDAGTPDDSGNGKPEAAQAEASDRVSARAEGGSHVDYSRTFRALAEGDVVSGVVVHIDKEGVLVDVGTKSEGIIRPGELAAGHVQSVEDIVSVGDRIDVMVIQSENEEGNLVLSKKRADFEKAWERVQQAFEEEKVLTAMVSDRVKGGLVVDLGIRGFVPGSHVGNGRVKNLERYVGQSLPLKVVEVDRERRKVILSHRLAVEEEQAKQREETVGSLAEGEVRPGTVRRITDYGAFVDLGGIDGLLHISEMSWTRINHPSEVVKVGQKIHVMILKLNLEAGRVSLGLRQILPDPWAEIERKYNIGDVIRGPISRLVPFGTFVQLEGGVEAIIPNAELSERRVKKPEDVVSVGEVVEAKVIDIRSEERRMILSMRQMHQEKERREYESYQTSNRFESGGGGGMTLGDLIGDKLQELTADRSDETEREEPKTEEPVVEAPVAEAEAVTEEPGAEAE